MISDNTISSIDTVRIFITKSSLIRPKSGECLDPFKDRGKHIRVIVGSFVLDDGHKTLETHAGVDVLCG